jgi:hypothetical protein
MGSIHLAFGRLLSLIAGLTLLVLSLALCAAASLARDRAQGISLPNSSSRTKSIGAVFAAVMAGVMSSMLNIGFVYGAPLAKNAKAAGCPVFLTTTTIWVPVLLGGLIFNLGYPAYRIWRASSWSTLLQGVITRYYGFGRLPWASFGSAPSCCTALGHRSWVRSAPYIRLGSHRCGFDFDFE